MAVVYLSSSNEWEIRVNGNWEEILQNGKKKSQKQMRLNVKVNRVELPCMYRPQARRRQSALEHKITALWFKLPTAGGSLSFPTTW